MLPLGLLLELIPPLKGINIDSKLSVAICMAQTEHAFSFHVSPKGGGWEPNFHLVWNQEIFGFLGDNLKAIIFAFGGAP